MKNQNLLRTLAFLYKDKIDVSLLPIGIYWLYIELNGQVKNIPFIKE